MTLREILEAIDALTLDELLQLRAHIDQRLSPDERARLLREAFEQLRVGLTQAELNEITDAMNAEYIEPVDVDVWRD